MPRPGRPFSPLFQALLLAGLLVTILSACSSSTPLLGPEAAMPEAQAAKETQDTNSSVDETSTPAPDTGTTEADNNSNATTLDANTVVSCNASDQHMQQRTLELINDARSLARRCGFETFDAADPLTWNTQLLQAASRQSADMAQHNFFSHTGSDGSSVSDRVSEAGYDWSTVGENIAAGQESATASVAGWLSSPGHCRNLMNPDFTQMAVTCVEDSGSDYGRYWTNVLAAPR